MGTFCLKLNPVRAGLEECGSLPSLSAPIRATNSQGTATCSVGNGLCSTTCFHLVLKCIQEETECICTLSPGPLSKVKTATTSLVDTTTTCGVSPKGGKGVQHPRVHAAQESSIS